MSLVRFNSVGARPFGDIFDNFFDDFFQKESVSAIQPKVDVIENDKTYEIHLALPGFDKNDVKVEIIDGYISISGERTFKKEENNTYHRVETSYGAFERRFQLPQNINEDKIDAEFKNGILFVKLHKQKESILKRLISIK